MVVAGDFPEVLTVLQINSTRLSQTFSRAWLLSVRDCAIIIRRRGGGELGAEKPDFGGGGALSKNNLKIEGAQNEITLITGGGLTCILCHVQKNVRTILHAL